ncbi:MAG: hypothetical protein LBH51_02315 [Treponema sp.]|nr:hypothetical protein [Treponema sp.]
MPVFFLVFFLESCGIESYHYLPPVPSSNITSSLNQFATILLPGISSNDFTHFAFYYRIYISYSNRTGFSLSSEDLREINQTLYSDYSYLNPYTSTTNTTTVNIASVMSNRGYQPLYFETSSGDISGSILNNSGIEIHLEFPSNNTPYLRIGSDSFPLKRSDGGGSFTPLPPDRYFRNTSDLNNDANITTTTNADVVGPSSGGSGIRHAYVSLYIVSAGLNEQTYTPIFSIPSFVGIFLLPNQ